MRVSRRERSFWLLTYGCQMNKLDSELAASRLVQAGYRAAASEDDADILLLNTCAVREHAEDRVWGRLASLAARKRERPELVLGVLGCMAQEHEALVRERAPQVDIVCGTREFGAIDELVTRVLATRRAFVATGGGATGDAIEREVGLRPSRAQAFVTIIRGCNMPCSFCIVPRTRGPEVSRPVAEVRAEVERLVADGVSEVTLLGQTVNAYGHDLARGARGRVDLAVLLRELGAVEGLRRLSFVTSHPSFVDARLIDAIAELDLLSRCLHLPVQSGSDAMLARMKRGYTRARYVERVEALRAAVPDLELATDFIVGFPGETEADHELSLSLVEELGFAQSFVFKYSPRATTASDELYDDDVPAAVKRRRNAEVLALQERVSLAKNRAFVGKVVEVLVEGPSKRGLDRYTGRTACKRVVHFDRGNAAQVGRYLRVRIDEAGAYSLVGKLASGRVPEAGAAPAAAGASGG